MRVKRAGGLTKVVILTLLAAGSITLLSLQRQISQAKEQQGALELQVERQAQINADLRLSVENSSDPAAQADIARGEWGFVLPGEKMILFTD